MFGRVPGIRQHDVADCGAACLRAIGLYHGKRISVARLRQHASTDRHGTNVLGLVEAAERFGFTAKGVRAGADALASLPLPAIVHLRLDNGLLHYCVLHRIQPAHAELMDPAEGRSVRMPREEFLRQWTGVVVLIVPSDRFGSEAGDKPASSRLWELARPNGRMLFRALAGAAASTALGLSTAIYVRIVVDHVLAGGNLHLLTPLALAMLALLCLQVYLGWAKSRIALQVGERIDRTLMLAYHRHLLHLPQRFFDTMRLGESISRLGDAVKVRILISEAAVEIAVNLLTLMFAFALMLIYSWKLALIAGTIIPLYAAVFACVNGLDRRYLRATMERSAELESQLIESVGGATMVKRFGLHGWMHRKVELCVTRLLDPVFRSARASIITAQANEFLSRAAVIVLFWSGAVYVAGGLLSTGELLGLYTLLAYLTGPLARLLSMNRMVQDALIAADRLFEILDLDQEDADENGLSASPVEVPAGDIRFEGVTFRYGNRNPALNGLDLVVREGWTTALVGASGGGKSTILALLQKLYLPGSGCVLIGDVDLNRVPRAQLRALIGVVPQDVQVLTASVLENITLGSEPPDAERVLRICRDLGLHDFFESLPFGYATELGESGLGLSGGQRQRLALARALYREPRILLLDEATSNLDPAAEAAVEKCLERLRTTGVTVIAICHRLEFAMKADRIAVIADGKVVEEGSHDELIRRDGAYRRLWVRQHPHLPGTDREDVLLATTAAGADLP